MITKEIASAFASFSVRGSITEAEQITAGLINATYLVKTDADEKYILQKINTFVFKDVEGLMNNIVGVTKHLNEKIKLAGGDEKREALSFIQSDSGKYYHIDSQGSAWRMYVYVDDAITYNKAESREVLMSAGVSFGRFMKLLADYPADTLSETIANFHNTPSRYKDFMDAVEKDTAGRRHQVEKEIAFITERQADTHRFTDLLAEGKLPLRVTHNDTKLNNVLFDKATNKSICVIDLDTIMPGLSLYDFGDSIRSGVNSAKEDETDLDKIYIDLELFEGYTDGYLSETAESLTDAEIENLAFSAKLMTFECGMRFLTDYLNGDVYFRTAYEGHNLVRARNQFRLIETMEQNMDKMQEIVMKYKEKYCAKN
ncbi:MAG: aminoglycoside phosphotransferase family protein [Clostridia bacterium]|nr:aminoglycoside phosphotransferase family protein [Clostridia bacterium]